jgi:hypothetical protein
MPMFDSLLGRRRNKPIPERFWNRLENRKLPKSTRTVGFFRANMLKGCVPNHGRNF